jgi:hypothetical protein
VTTIDSLCARHGREGCRQSARRACASLPSSQLGVATHIISTLVPGSSSQWSAPNSNTNNTPTNTVGNINKIKLQGRGSAPTWQKVMFCICNKIYIVEPLPFSQAYVWFLNIFCWKYNHVALKNSYP